MQPLIASSLLRWTVICRLAGDMSWAHNSPIRNGWRIVSSNAQPGGTLLFGRVTYDLMIRYWPTPRRKQQNPAVADGMNSAPKT